MLRKNFINAVLTAPILLVNLSACQTTEVLRSSTNTPDPVVYDVDTGRDDAWLLLSSSRHNRMPVFAVIAGYGNTTADNTVRNSLDVLYFSRQGRSLPQVWRGEEQPLSPATPIALAEIARRAGINGNGICNVTLPRSTDIAHEYDDKWAQNFRDRIIQANKKIDYVVTGPMTSLAKLIDAFGQDSQGHYRILRYVDTVTIMGGSLAQDLPVDFNFKADPSAADQVLRVFAEKARIVPFDETRKLALTRSDIDKLTAQDSSGQLSLDIIRAFEKGWSQGNPVLLHDPATLLVEDYRQNLAPIRVRVALSGDNAGKLIQDPQGTAILKFTIPNGMDQTYRNYLLNHYMGLRTPHINMNLGTSRRATPEARP